jgi:hypothetical protein
MESSPKLHVLMVDKSSLQKNEEAIVDPVGFSLCDA